jgi:GNAT superfamily N-acetyltransferase
VFVAKDSTRFVGFAITVDVPASLRLGHSWQIRDLFVLPTHRRLGVGRALLASVRAAAIASSAMRLVVQTEDDNEPALRLYADSGFAPTEGYCSLTLPLGPEPR